MFTGIIEEIGTVKNIIHQGTSIRIQIGALKVLEDLETDQSISVNGVCLTVVEIENDSFTADAVSETIAKTTLSQSKKNTHVNLERALRLKDRLGGHLVQGHVDSTGSIIRISNNVYCSTIVIEIPQELQNYTISKGSIAVDGVSLTIAEKNKNVVNIAIIPHTLQNTIFQFKKPGDKVNIEVDFLAKYIELLINQSSETKLTPEWLKQQGF